MAQILTGPTPTQLAIQDVGDPIVRSLRSLASQQLQNIENQRQRANLSAGLQAFMPKEQAELASFTPESILGKLLPGMQKQQLEAGRVARTDAARAKRSADRQAKIDALKKEAQTIDGDKKLPGLTESDKDEIASDTFENQQKIKELEHQEDIDKIADDEFDLVMGQTGNAVAATNARQSVIDTLNKESSAITKEDRKRVSRNIAVAEADAKIATEAALSHEESADNYDAIIDLLKTGKALTGLPASLLEWAGIDKGVLPTESQIIQKRLAAEPIRALRNLPAQAARLSKVFDTLKDMHGSLSNAPEGLMIISRLKKAEARGGVLVEKAYSAALEKNAATGKRSPGNLKTLVKKKLVKQLNKIGSEMQYIISDGIEELNKKQRDALPANKREDLPDLSVEPIGTEIEDENGNKFKKEDLFGKPTWVQKG